MAEIKEIGATAVEDVDVSHLHHRTAGAKEEMVLSVALTDAVAKDNISMTSKSILKLYGILSVITFACCMNGYDGSVMSSLNAMDTWHDYFNVGTVGSEIGLVTAIYSAGSTIGCAFASPGGDIYGRRFGISLGSAIILIGTIVQASTTTLSGFIGGRFLVGLGVPIVTTSGPTYLIEMAYPTWRGACGGLYNVLSWYIGALTASWSCYGLGFLNNNWSWRVPLIIQAVPAVICMLAVWLLPESPRWLFMHDRYDEGRKILIKYHGDGNEDSAVVKLECEEIQASVVFARGLANGQKWWDFRVLWSSWRISYRFWLVMLVSVFSQFIGGAMSYYMPSIYTSLGIDGQQKQLLLTGLNQVIGIGFGCLGSFMVDWWGRRPLFLWGTFLTGLVYLVMNVLAARAGSHIGNGAGYAFITMTFLYGAIFSFCWTPLQALYPAEIMRNDFRIKGMAAQGLISSVAGFVNLYAFPIALDNITWRTYTIYLVIHFVEWAFMWYGLVETKGRSIEELDEIFEAPHPVKASLQKTSVVYVKGVGVKVEEGV